MPSLDAVLKFRAEMYARSRALIEVKGHDYNRQQQSAGDTLFNLRVAEMLGIVPTAERGILVRLSDKFMRLISLMEPGVDPAVAGESVRDTVADIHNYVDYALQMFEERVKLPPWDSEGRNVTDIPFPYQAPDVSGDSAGAYPGDGGGSVQQRAKERSCAYPFDHDPPCVALPDDSILNDQRLFLRGASTPNVRR